MLVMAPHESEIFPTSCQTWTVETSEFPGRTIERAPVDIIFEIRYLGSAYC